MKRFNRFSVLAGVIAVGIAVIGLSVAPTPSLAQQKDTQGLTSSRLGF